MATTVSRVRSETLRTAADDNVARSVAVCRPAMTCRCWWQRRARYRGRWRLVAQGLRGTHECRGKASCLSRRPVGNHCGVHGSRTRRLPGRAEEPGAGATAFRTGVGGRRSRTCSLAGCLALAPIL